MAYSLLLSTRSGIASPYPIIGRIRKIREGAEERESTMYKAFHVGWAVPFKS